MLRRVVVMAGCVTLIGCSGSTGPSPQGSGGMVRDSLLYAGTFHSVSAAAQGMAEVHLTGGARLLLFTSDFATEINPDVEVWLVAADDASDSQTVLQSAHLSLGALESGTGAQSYAVPDSVDFSVYRSVTVWCVRAHVNFATAPLTPP